MGAAGALEAAFCIMAIHTQVVNPQPLRVTYLNPNPNPNLNPSQNTALALNL